MARPFPKSHLALLFALRDGKKRLHSAGGFTFFEHDSRISVRTPVATALIKAGLIEVDEPPLYRISEAGRQKLEEFQKVA